MHNSYPQLGYMHKGLGVYVYHDVPQMGSWWTDLRDSITGGAKDAINNATDNIQDQIKDATPSIKNTILSYFMDTPTGERLVAEAKEGWLAQQQENVRVFYLNNKGTINMALVGVGVVAVGLALYKARSSGIKAGKRATASLAAPAAATANPRRRRRRKARRNRRKSRR